MGWTAVAVFVVGAVFGALAHWALVWTTDAIETMFTDWEDGGGADGQ